MQFFSDLLKVRTVWVEKSNGQWARKRRLHPVLNIFFWGGVLAFVALLSVKLLSGGSTQVPSSDLNALSAADLSKADAPRQSLIAQVSVESSANASSGMLIASTGTEEPPEFVAETNASIKVSVLPDEPVQSTPNLRAANAAVTSPSSPSQLISRPSSTQTAPATPVRSAATLPATPRPAQTSPAPGNSRDYWIQINKSDYTLALFKGDEIVREYLIAVGRNPGDKQYVGDNRTPEGDFRVVSIENAASWSHDFRDGKGKIRGAYGPWFIRLSAKGWKGIGIHGTHDPDSLGTMATEGCIRMSNDEVQELKRYAYRNMRVVVNP